MNGLYDEFKIALHSVWIRRWLSLAVAWGLCLLGWLVVALIPNSYESQARISVEMQSILSDKVGVDARERKKNMERVQETLASTINLEKVVRGTALNQSVATDRELSGKVEMLRKSIKIKSERQSVRDYRDLFGEQFIRCRKCRSGARYCAENDRYFRRGKPLR
jgi:succinoglycan biosynthesis transport protein ExoP